MRRHNRLHLFDTFLESRTVDSLIIMFTKNALPTALLGLSVFADLCNGFGLGGLGFKRTVADVSPVSTAYTSQAGTFNLTASQLSQDYKINSYWTIYFLHGSNGHDYFAVGHLSAKGSTPKGANIRVSLLDINDSKYFGTEHSDPNAVFSNETFYYKADKFETYSTASDLYSNQVVKSTVEGAEFTLVSEPKGPNFYDAGSGIYMWGTDWTYEAAYPEQWVTGNLTYNGELIDIVPEKSMSWLDRQFGPGFGAEGWHLWILMFDNGIKTCIWRSEAVGAAPKQYFATFMFPDGHHEVYPIADEIHQSQPFVSNQTGFTYYGRHKVSIPGIGAEFDIRQPTLAGEMTSPTDPTPLNTLYEGYAIASGHIGGQRVSGWGVAERKYPSI
ncbi:kievitone hydratase [Ophiostoma piceae UAMH 11346]|uniref:Kievitone hydratase n=1 Tax=Ophiostoma piceae (strain UAMH 11346) TaxID=1262450 RepID=S3C8J9_OPHP1|nr:kievitone hydratase [Ophiostoma piceae UAMH 11346]